MKAERASAEFRGTTMYAPVRAHQGKDLSFRSVTDSLARLLDCVLACLCPRTFTLD